MKRKITAVLLCVALLLTLSVNVSAQDAQAQTVPVTNEITINVSKNNTAVITEPITTIDSGATRAAAATPIGHLDTVSTSIIGGWAYQSNIPNTALTVHIYIINNSTGEQKIIPVTAGGYRADLAAAGYGNGYHAFHYAINWKTYKPGTYTVRAYAIGVNSTNPQLNSSPKTFTVRNPSGSVDGISSSCISGWAWKPDAPNSTIGVHAHIIQGDTVLEIKTTYADVFRQDLKNAGYGNGYHGFSIPIDWSQYPEERLRVLVYAVDGSGYNPSFYSGYYDNRKQISLLGMVESKYFHDLSTWSRTAEVEEYCENIGCTNLTILNRADDDVYTNYIKNSSYCVIFTHGGKSKTPAGQIVYDRIQWSMKGIYNDHRYCEDHYCNTCFGDYTTDDLNELPTNYFVDTRCVVLMSCESGKSGQMDPTNFVNVLQSKGVWTVVGFENEIHYYYTDTDPNPDIHTDDIINTNLGAQLWIAKFTKYLGEGYSVTAAKDAAFEETIFANLAYNNYTKYELDNNLIPEQIKTEKILCGLDSCYIAGNPNQVVKH